MAALAERAVNAAAMPPATSAPACAPCSAAAGSSTTDDAGVRTRYPHSLLEMRETGVFTTESFDIAPKPLGQGKFGEHYMLS
jgi:hypothetical protein